MSRMVRVRYRPAGWALGVTPARASALVAVMLATGPGGAAAQGAGGTDPVDWREAAQALKGDPKRGEAAFEACADCHRRSAGGRSDGAVPRLAGQHGSVIIKQVGDIRTGKRLNEPMRPFVSGPEMTPQRLADLASFLQALPIAGPIGKGPGTALDRGRTLFAQECAPCHGAAGEGIAEAAHPMLASQHYGYLLRELGMIRDGSRGNSNSLMRERIQSFPAADLEALADYLSRLPPPQR